jgi:IPT/TIG domain
MRRSHTPPEMTFTMRHLLSTFVAVAILTVATFAQNITDVSPSVGSIGTTITITGNGAGTKKPSVYLTSPETGTKKYALKVVSHSDTQIVATVSKGLVGTFDLNVKVGSVVITATDALTLAPPSITPGQTITAAVGSTISLNGTHFGNKKGKVSISAANASVVSWTDTVITCKVPTKIPNGAVVVNLTNSLGADAISGCLTVTGSSVVLGKDKVTGKINGKTFKPKIHFVFVNNGVWSLQMIELGKHARTLAFDHVALTTIPGIFDGTGNPAETLTLDIAGGGGSFAGVPGEFTITITHHEGGKLAGVISGQVTGPGNVKMAVQDVEFLYGTGGL